MAGKCEYNTNRDKTGHLWGQLAAATEDGSAKVTVIFLLRTCYCLKESSRKSLSIFYSTILLNLERRKDVIFCLHRDNASAPFIYTPLVSSTVIQVQQP